MRIVFGILSIALGLGVLVALAFWFGMAGRRAAGKAIDKHPDGTVARGVKYLDDLRP